LVSLNEPIKANITDTLKGKYIELSLSDSLDNTLLDNLMQLEPTGEANPKPLFLDRNARFVNYSTFGKNKKHLKGVIRGKYKNIPVIGFNMADRTAEVNLNEPCNVLYAHSFESYNQRSSWRVHIRDVFPA
ncbi:MAG: hypothetical protein ACR2PH_00200, partial [Desulfobulbia bacterium]